MNEDFFDRLDKYIEYKGLNDNKVTVQTGIPIGSLGKQRKGSRGLSVQSIAKILYTYDDLNAEWLLTGKGSMLRDVQKSKSGCPEEENTSLIRELIEKNGELQQQIGKLIHENETLKKQIKKLKDEDRDKSPRHTIHSGSNIAAEPEVKYK